MFDYEETGRKMLEWLRPAPPTDEEAAAASNIEHGDYEIYSHKLDAALEEARSDFIRTAVSTMAKSGDLVVGLHDRHGDTVTASCGTYLHAPIAQLPVKFLIDKYLGEGTTMLIEPGDLFSAN
jgi:N-methylhydantoinase B/oxoprolinase/acetone carboxylase alpha subunit